LITCKISPSLLITFFKKNDLKTQFPFSEKPVYLKRDSVCGPAYDFLSKGVTEATVTDNSGKALDSYTVTKSDAGFTIRKGGTNSPDHSCMVTLNKLEQSNALYGKIGQVNDCQKYKRTDTSSGLKSL
jgi:hypothetical protein